MGVVVSMAFSSRIFAGVPRLLLLPHIATFQPIAQRKHARVYFSFRPEVAFCFGNLM